jgi:phage regulator Rha-like protein
MVASKVVITVPDEVIMSKIYLIRGVKVLLDRDLAQLYGVETKVLKQTVRRNKKRFPSDFMFEMSFEELQQWRSQFVTSISDIMGLRHPPFCFTEHGVLMLASVLNSDRAIHINIQIVRVFIKMRQILQTNKELFEKLNNTEKKLLEHDKKIILVFKFIKHLQDAKQKELGFKKRKRIGFK